MQRKLKLKLPPSLKSVVALPFEM